MPSDSQEHTRTAMATAPEDLVQVMGLQIHDLHRDTIAQRVIAAVTARKKMLVLNANAHLVNLAQHNDWMPAMFAQADIAFCDGAGVQLAMLLLKGRRANRTTPPEWIGGVLETLGDQASIFWLGGTPEAVAAAARNYESRYGVRTAGTQHGYFNQAKDSQDTRELVDRINRAQPTILLVNMGMPRQERWLWDNWDRLRPGVAITAGALVDHAAGQVQRPPRWVANLGIEWLVRLLREPKRLWRRYLLGLPVFGAHVLRYAVSR
jgi:N-acetylglucosaminyldiphosphoundecaprenol N-acetyl-beta-D-mannosaminyltransferase